MFGILQTIKKKLSIAIPITMLAGMGVGYAVDTSPLKIIILPLTMLMIYPMMVTLNFKSLASRCNHRAQGLTQALNLVVLPLVAYGLGRLFFSDQPLYAFGLLLIGLLPTSGMTISWTGFAKGNVKLAVKMTVLGLIIGAIITPFYASALMGTQVSLPIMKTVQQIGLVIFVPMILGMITKQLIVQKWGTETFDKKIKPKFPLFSTLGVLGMIFVAMSLKATAIIDNPMTLVQLLAPILLFYLVAFTLGTLAGKLLPDIKDRPAMVYSSAMRNLSIALAIALTVFEKSQGAQMALVIAVAFIVQVQGAAWYLKLIPKLQRRPQINHAISKPQTN